MPKLTKQWSMICIWAWAVEIKWNKMNSRNITDGFNNGKSWSLNYIWLYCIFLNWKLCIKWKEAQTNAKLVEEYFFSEKRNKLSVLETMRSSYQLYTGMKMRKLAIIAHWAFQRRLCMQQEKVQMKINLVWSVCGTKWGSSWQKSEKLPCMHLWDGP